MILLESINCLFHTFQNSWSSKFHEAVVRPLAIGFLPHSPSIAIAQKATSLRPMPPSKKQQGTYEKIQGTASNQSEHVAQEVTDIGDDEPPRDIPSFTYPEDLGFSFLTKFSSNSSSTHLTARHSEPIIIVVKDQLCYLLSIELSSHIDEQRSSLLLTLSSLTVVGTCSRMPKHRLLRSLLPIQRRAREREDKAKVIRDKVASLEGQLSHLKVEIIELKTKKVMQ
ncbi:hypothetical protein GH714_039198 [Hevea brasiliensis]|uniref:Uncharacterized protein n=1 Tax=Hevea brasiliensis TaxID=3981 RepID=A0A6A6KYW8_HEVBR|nr:hypothetical protein GH714_039198 [Hevea brasiliensis]